MREVVLVPIKSFDVGKSRLRAAMAGSEVASLMRSLARGVIDATRPRPCWVLCDDDEVARFADACGAAAVRVPGDGLNAAVRAGYDAARLEFDATIVAHADLVAPASLAAWSVGTGITIATDRHGSGTNVLSLPTGLDFTFLYGSNSARAHRAEAERLGLAVTVLTQSPWAVDLDEPADLALLPDAK